jgi:ankyrin repeat protein
VARSSVWLHVEDKDGHTPLDTATECGHSEAADLLHKQATVEVATSERPHVEPQFNINCDSV